MKDDYDHGCAYYDDIDDHYDCRSGWMWSYFTNLKMSEKVGPLKKQKLTKPSTIDVMIHCTQIWDSPLIRQQESQLFKTPHSRIWMIKLWMVCTWFHLMKFLHAFKVHVDVCLVEVNKKHDHLWPVWVGIWILGKLSSLWNCWANAWVFPLLSKQGSPNQRSHWSERQDWPFNDLK